MVHRFVRAAIDRQVASRVAVFGFSQRDITNYLDPTAFGAQGRTWAELRSQWQKSKVRDFKEWMKAQGWSINQKSVKKAVERMQAVPSEFTDLLRLCESAVRPKPGTGKA